MNDKPMVETGDPVISTEDANWAMVRSSLAAMAEQQTAFINELRETRRVDGQFLIGRFDTVEASVARLREAVKMQNDLMDALNTIVSGVRSASNSTYDMAKSAALKIERVRQFLKVPDEVVAEAPASGEGAAEASDRPPRSVRG